MYQQLITKAVKAIFNDSALTDCTPIGAGFYGKVYAVKLSKPPYSAAIKIFFRRGDNEKEALWYLALRRSGIPLPEIYGMYDEGEHGVLAMSLLKACSATDTSGLTCRELDKLGDEIAETAVKLHLLKGSGYGDITDVSCLEGGKEDSWTEYYRIKAKKAMDNISRAVSRGLLDRRHENIYYRALDAIDIAIDTPSYPALIHGDLNTDNIMIDKKMSRVVAVIDPISSMWGDYEYELFQLDCASGKAYGLLDKYAQSRPLSDKYDLKSAIYSAFAEGNHYCNINKACDDNLSTFIARLDFALNNYGL